MFWEPRVTEVRAWLTVRALAKDWTTIKDLHHAAAMTYLPMREALLTFVGVGLVERLGLRPVGYYRLVAKPKASARHFARAMEATAEKFGRERFLGWAS